MKEDPQAFNAYVKLVGTCQGIKSNYLEIGKLLSELKVNDKYKEAVGDTDTWNMFLKQPEIGLSIREADQLIEIYDLYVGILHIDEDYLASISLKNLKRMIPVVREIIQTTEDKVPTTELFEQARTLSDQDFREVLAENNGVTERTYTYSIMKRAKETGSMTKVHGITSDEIIEKFNLNG